MGRLNVGVRPVLYAPGGAPRKGTREGSHIIVEAQYSMELTVSFSDACSSRVDSADKTACRQASFCEDF